MSFFDHFLKLPDMKAFSLEPYPENFSLDRLVPGVDNVRYDVRLSPEFMRITSKVIQYLIAGKANAKEVMDIGQQSTWLDFRDEFEWYYCDVLLSAVNLAKLHKEIQIDFLAQTAIVKMVIEELRKQYDYMIECYIKAIRKKELASNRDGGLVFNLKEELSRIRLNRPVILRSAGFELFEYLTKIQGKQIKEVREINFGSNALIHSDFFTNPILHVEDVRDDFFMLEEYKILLGRRFDDPDRYLELINMLRFLFRYVAESEFKNKREKQGETEVEFEARIESWMKQVGNIDKLLNYFITQKKYKTAKRKKTHKNELDILKKKIKSQKKLLKFFYYNFNQKGLIKKILAAYEIQPIVKEYCPPLVPHQVAQFLINPLKRRSIVRRLKRSEKFYRKSFTIKSLKKQTISLEKKTRRERKKLFIEFLKGFIRYHRDLENYKVLKEAMDYVNLARDEKIINLSRINRTLFEYLLPQEAVLQEKPIVNHVIIKADVRGSTNITYQLRQRQLNPASYFSLNFFDPITDILSEYGAVKVFIEGDAIILAIYEHEDSPEGWYSVARACGLAMNMLSIVRRYNVQSKKKCLPILELGVGICFYEGPPAFLFDGENRIMISPAINQADRLSGCSYILRKHMKNAQKPFNLYVFQTKQSRQLTFSSCDDVYLRYNVNGIELSPAAFEKLAGEIELKAVEAVLPDISRERLKIYIGKYPTITGDFKRLIIREGLISPLTATNPSESKRDSRKYYEVCTNSSLMGYIQKLLTK